MPRAPTAAIVLEAGCPGHPRDHRGVPWLRAGSGRGRGGPEPVRYTTHTVRRQCFARWASSRRGSRQVVVGSWQLQPLGGNCAGVSILVLSELDTRSPPLRGTVLKVEGHTQQSHGEADPKPTMEAARPGCQDGYRGVVKTRKATQNSRAPDDRVTLLSFATDRLQPLEARMHPVEDDIEACVCPRDPQPRLLCPVGIVPTDG